MPRAYGAFFRSRTSGSNQYTFRIRMAWLVEAREEREKREKREVREKREGEKEKEREGEKDRCIVAVCSRRLRSCCSFFRHDQSQHEQRPAVLFCFIFAREKKAIINQFFIWHSSQEEAREEERREKREDSFLFLFSSSRSTYKAVFLAWGLLLVWKSNSQTRFKKVSSRLHSNLPKF